MRTEGCQGRAREPLGAHCHLSQHKPTAHQPGLCLQPHVRAQTAALCLHGDRRNAKPGMYQMCALERGVNCAGKAAGWAGPRHDMGVERKTVAILTVDLSPYLPCGHVWVQGVTKIPGGALRSPHWGVHTGQPLEGTVSTSGHPGSSGTLLGRWCGLLAESVSKRGHSCVHMCTAVGNGPLGAPGFWRLHLLLTASLFTNQPIYPQTSSVVTSQLCWVPVGPAFPCRPPPPQGWCPLLGSLSPLEYTCTPAMHERPQQCGCSQAQVVFRAHRQAASACML